MPLLFLLACHYDVYYGKDTAPLPDPNEDTGFDADTGGFDTPPVPEEVCNGLDDDLDGLVDEDFPDSDEDGRADCVDPTCPDLTLGVAGPVDIDPTCQAPAPPDPTPDPWAVRERWRVVASNDGFTHVIGAPVVGPLYDDDGDGDVDADDDPYVAVPMGGVNLSVGGLVVFHGATGAEVLSGARVCRPRRHRRGRCW
jgi:hypothetical protein